MRKLLQELREALGRMDGRPRINQAELGALLTPKRQISAVQGYEGGRFVPKEYISQFAELARKADRPLLADQFTALLSRDDKPELVKSPEAAIVAELKRISAGVDELLARIPKRPRSSRGS